MLSVSHRADRQRGQLSSCRMNILLLHSLQIGCTVPLVQEKGLTLVRLRTPYGCMHTGHSSLHSFSSLPDLELLFGSLGDNACDACDDRDDRDGCDLCDRFLVFAGRVDIIRRTIPSTMSENNKIQFIELAKRQMNEYAISYSILSHGLNAYMVSKMCERQTQTKA